MEETTVKEALKVLKQMVKDGHGDDECVLLLPAAEGLIRVEDCQAGPVSTLGQIFHDQNGFKEYINARVRNE